MCPVCHYICLDVKVAKTWTLSHTIISCKERSKQDIEHSLEREPRKRSMLGIWAFNSDWINRGIKY